VVARDPRIFELNFLPRRPADKHRSSFEDVDLLGLPWTTKLEFRPDWFGITHGCTQDKYQVATAAGTTALSSLGRFMLYS